MFDTAAGIRLEKRNHFIIAPNPGRSFQFVKAHYQSIYGMVRVEWVREESKYSYKIEIPCNTTADIILSDGRREKVLAGTYRFE